jgi:hypothetical protein
LVRRKTSANEQQDYAQEKNEERFNSFESFFSDSLLKPRCEIDREQKISSAGNLNLKVKYNRTAKQKAIIKQASCLKPAR